MSAVKEERETKRGPRRRKPEGGRGRRRERELSIGSSKVGERMWKKPEGGRENGEGVRIAVADLGFEEGGFYV